MTTAQLSKWQCVDRYYLAVTSSTTAGVATIVAPGDLDTGIGSTNSTLTAGSTLPANAGIMVGNIITAGGGGSLSSMNGTGAGFFGGNGGSVTIQATGNIPTHFPPTSPLSPNTLYSPIPLSTPILPLPPPPFLSPSSFPLPVSPL